MKNLSRLLLAILVTAVPVSFCALAVWLPVYMNNLRLENFAENLYRYPLPPNTKALEQRAEVSKLGNGNNCSYRAQQAMVSTLPREEIQKYYEAVTLPRVSVGQWNDVYNSPTVTNIDLEFDEVQSDMARSYFTLTLFDVGLDNTLDVRCH